MCLLHNNFTFKYRRGFLNCNYFNERANIRAPIAIIRKRVLTIIIMTRQKRHN